MWKPHDMLLVIGELTMEKRILEDQLEQANAQIQEMQQASLEEENVVKLDERAEYADGHST